MLVLLVAATLRLPLLDLPLERDEGAYAVVASEMRHGAIPYRDVFDHKPPVIHLAYLLGQGVLGEGVRSVRLLALLAACGTCAALWGLGRALEQDLSGMDLDLEQLRRDLVLLRGVR